MPGSLPGQSQKINSSQPELNDNRKQRAGPENTPRPPPNYITDVTNSSPLIQLLEQMAVQPYEVKALAHNQVKVQPKISESYQTIIKALAEKRKQFRTYKLKEERNYRVVLKNIHYSISPEEIKTEIENLGHTVTNTWNINSTEISNHFPCFCTTEACPE
jgi:hypothetical protein